MEKKAKNFEFSGYKLLENRQNIELQYGIGFQDGERLEFTEKLTFPTPFPSSPQIDVLIEKTLQALHLICGLSYWKAYCPRTIVIKTAPLTKKQAEFWNIVYTKGLGEFFYQNKIDFRELIQFPYSEDVVSSPTDIQLKERALMGVGGGKDSIVAYEQLKQENYPTTAFLLETQKGYDLINDVINVMDIEALRIQRQIDPRLFELEGAFNGHIPITAIYSVVGVLCAVAYDYKKVIMSNEKSANYGNVTYLDSEINHQWSKSEEFEQLFKEYIGESITPSIEYSSLLRSLTEIQITEKFVNYPQYFNVFSSCNNNFKIYKESLKKSRWCGVCPKCAFVFSMLAAYLPKQKVVEIFNKNLYEDEHLLDLYRELLGIKDFKPFECVGTPDEVKTAFEKAHQKGEYKDDVVMKMFESEVLSK